LIAITNGKIVTPDEIIENQILLIDKGRIHSFSQNTDGAETVVDAQGRYILPGLIDVHSDKIEQFIQPRPTSQMDFAFAFNACERDLLSSGITTMYHSIALFQDELFGKSPLRTSENVKKITDLIVGNQPHGRLIRHRVHLRIEIDNLDAYDLVQDMIRQGKVHQISFMDHTPGQGQYRNLEVYYDSISPRGGKEIETMGFEGVLEHHKTKQTLSLRQMKELAALARANEIAVASHDDDCDEKLAINKEIGVDISEFPISLDVAKSAKAQGLFTVVGAPNILRGCSHSGNMSGAEAVLEDLADIICSDYYPAAILHSVFHMHTKYGVPLPQMVNRVTFNPARAMGTADDYGSIEPGKKADLLIVDMIANSPAITHVFVDGNQALNTEYWR